MNELTIAKARETRYNAPMKKTFEEIIAAFTPSGDGRLDSLLKFTALAEEMDSIARRTKIADGSRAQNDAEHSWRIALMALLFKEYFAQDVDERKAALLCLAHDLVEIYAGDTFAYDAAANVGKEEREEAAAQKLFGQLPSPLRKLHGPLGALLEQLAFFDRRNLGRSWRDSRYGGKTNRPFKRKHAARLGMGSKEHRGWKIAWFYKRMSPRAMVARP